MKSHPLLRNRKSKGFGLLEVILVFALVIGAAAVVFTVFQSAKPSADASNEGSNISTIATNLKSTYGISNSYVGLTSTSAISAQVIPASMVSGTGSSVAINSGWGTVTVAADAGGSSAAVCANAGRCFDITYNSVPQAACLKLVQGIAGFFDDVTVDTADIFTAGKLDSAKAVTACSGGTSGAYSGTLVFIGH